MTRRLNFEVQQILPRAMQRMASPVADLGLIGYSARFFIRACQIMNRQC
jgi:hypothetical protein